MILFIVILVLIILIIGLVYIGWCMLKTNYWRRLFPDFKPCLNPVRYEVRESLNKRDNREGIASYSLYGNYPKYTPTLYRSLKSFNKLMPTWQASIYVPSDVPQNIVDALIYLGAEVNIMNRNCVGHEAALWRYLPAGQKLPFVSVDADDIFDTKTQRKIQTWLKSDKQFIIFHECDFFLPMVASGWGSRDIAVPDIEDKLNKYCETWFGFDEAFLKQEIWPIVQQNGFYKNVTVSTRWWFCVLVAIVLILIGYLIYLGAVYHLCKH